MIIGEKPSPKLTKAEIHDIADRPMSIQLTVREWSYVEGLVGTGYTHMTGKNKKMIGDVLMKMQSQFSKGHDNAIQVVK